MAIKKILLPVELPVPDQSTAWQAGGLAQHFGAEIVVLHVLSPLRFPTGLIEPGHQITARDLDRVLQSDFPGLYIRGLLLRGDPAGEILRTAHDECADLLVMETHGPGRLESLLRPYAISWLLHRSPCPLWLSSAVASAGSQDFAVRNILCALDLTAHSRYTLSAALKFAAACGATLTLAHVTPSFELYGPGGLHVEQPLKETLFGHATRVLTALQREAGCQVEVILEGGNVPRALNRAAKNAGSDLLILGRMPPGGHLGQNGGGLAIVRGSHIPVLCL